MTALNAETAKVVIDASSLDIEMIPEELGDVTVILTKQENKTLIINLFYKVSILAELFDADKR